jgi:hypothetical protein
MTLSEKPKLKTQSDKLPFWVRISDVLRLAKPFEIRVNLSEYHTVRAIRGMGHNYSYLLQIERTHPYVFQLVLEEHHTRRLAVIEGYLEAESNLEITHIRGKVYADHGVCLSLMCSCALLLVLFVNGFQLDFAVLFGSILVLTGYGMSFYDRHRILKDFKQRLAAGEDKRLVEDVKSEKFREEKYLSTMRRKLDNDASR